MRAATTSMQIGDDAARAPQGLSPALAARIQADHDPSASWLAHGGPIPRAVALQVPVVRRGVRLISGAIGSLPLARWRDGEQIAPGPLLEQPEAWRAYCRTIAVTVEDLVLYPCAWWRVTERDSWTGYPTKVVRLNPEFVQVQREAGSDEVTREWATYKGHIVPAGDLIRFDGPDEGLLHFARGAITTALLLEAAAARYASPEIPSGVLKQTSQYELTDAEVAQFMARWRASFNDGSTRWLNAGVDYVPVQSTAADLQLVEAREECALQVARHMGIPPRYLAVSYGDSMTYSNLESQRRDLTELDFTPYLNAIEQRLSMSDRNGCPRGQKVRFDLSDFARGVPLERAQRYSSLVPLGVMSVDEARAAEDLTGPAPKQPQTSPRQDQSPAGARDQGPAGRRDEGPAPAPQVGTP
ncbi:phage portal protein [Streptomyces spiroverticillatus]|uniref:Phage portal protein n=1 Tax=Streptomyces finlayi TaxID=67296 RepID=A0A918X1I3_9ACTN|nr:phage portal protein [Streptomyces spiroverticillatus]GHD03414.1 phage portal protein [Streptomyces finlayi]